MKAISILAVDDDPNQLEALKRTLQRSRYQVKTAPNGRIGLRMAAQNCPDLVLLDVSMPTMSGHEFLRRFRRLERRGVIGSSRASLDHVTEETPVIFVTALSQPYHRVDGLDAGVADYITKPFDSDELRARIRSQLRRVRRQRRPEGLECSEPGQSCCALSEKDTTVPEVWESLCELHKCLEAIDRANGRSLRELLSYRERLFVEARDSLQHLMRITTSDADNSHCESDHIRRAS